MFVYQRVLHTAEPELDLEVILFEDNVFRVPSPVSRAASPVLLDIFEEDSQSHDASTAMF